MATIQSSIELYDGFSPVLHNIMDAVNLTIVSIEHMQNELGANFDTTSLEGAAESIHQAGAEMAALNERIQSGGVRIRPNVDIPNPGPIDVSVHWRVDNMEVFTNSGIERFQQEIQSANTMMNTLFHTQAQVASAAGRMDILPPQANADLASMGNRLQAIQQRIQSIESNPINLGSDTANAELEHLRMQLSNAMNAQNDLNNAVQRMDVNAANQAYLRLSGTIGNVERELRDNVDEQGRLNQQIQNGTTAANGLLNSIKRIAGVYLGIQSVAKVINLSDTMAQTEARLSLIVDDGGSVEILQQEIFNAAQEARANYMTTAAAISKLGMQAGEAFSNNDELIAFTTLLNKEFVNAGTSAQGIDSVMLQLTQAMAAGKLQGEELNAVLDNAEPIVGKIKTYLEEVQGIDATNIKKLASEGVLTAEVIKNAMFYASDEINQSFDSMPMTFAQVANSIKNNAMVAFDPVLQRLNEIANSDRFQSMVDGVIGSLVVLADVAVGVFDVLTTGAAFVYDKWDLIGPVFYAVAGAVGFFTLAAGANAIALKAQAFASGLASFAANVHRAAVARQAGATFKATAAQYGFNAALLTCPITWIVLGIIAIIAAIGIVTAVINKVCDTSISAAGMIAGCIFYIMGAITNCGLLLDNVFFGAIEAAKATGNNIKEAFTASIKFVESVFYGLAAVAFGVISDISAQLAKLPFVEFDAAGIGEAAGKYASEIAAKGKKAASYTPDYQDVGTAWDEGFNTYEYLDLDTEFDRGYEWAENLVNTMKDTFSKEEESVGFDYSSLLNGLEGIDNNTGTTAGNTADIADNTSDIADNLEITDEDLKYLRDIAEREVIDRTVLKSVTIDMSGMVNKVENKSDLDGISTYLANSLKQQMKVSMEGA